MQVALACYKSAKCSWLVPLFLRSQGRLVLTLCRKISQLVFEQSKIPFALEFNFYSTSCYRIGSTQCCFNKFSARSFWQIVGKWFKLLSRNTMDFAWKIGYDFSYVVRWKYLDDYCSDTTCCDWSFWCRKFLVSCQVAFWTFTAEYFC